jgi:hypothetical protein
MSFSPLSYTASVDTIGNPKDPTSTAAIASAAATTVVKAAPGRIATITVTTAGTGTDNGILYDNATTGSGTILAVVAGGTAVGTILTINAPAVNGITAVNVGSGPAFTVMFS